MNAWVAFLAMPDPFNACRVGHECGASGDSASPIGVADSAIDI